MERIFAFTRKLRGKIPEKQSALDEFIGTALPGDTRSPVWRIQELDPNTDTPVEILHVVLLGFIKYFWRDAMARIPKDKKEILIARLSSLDVSGLGLSTLSGETLVTYAGSLTGRDFRVISQVAPLVLYDLLPSPCFEAWLALSAMVPLIWQPEIVNLDTHLILLQAAIDRFLDHTARWTPRWFNKPKFHIIQHLVDHIRRFGPAILFATEGFESFNAIIRGKSIHSNHQAPSRDIAHGFARANRIRHLLSGGVFLLATPDTTTLPHPRNGAQYCEDRTQWRTAGLLPLALTKPRGTASNPFQNLLPDSAYLSAVANVAGKYLTTASTRIDVSPYTTKTHFWPCSSAVSTQGDVYSPEGWVLWKNPQEDDLFVGRVAEILQVFASPERREGCADTVLLQCFTPSGIMTTYKLPAIRSSGWKLVPATDILCTVNVQHNCAKNFCRVTAHRAIYQEREKTSMTRLAIAHAGDPQDIMLNTFQMRNARYVQTLAVKIDSINREEAILAGARDEIDTQKSSGKKSKVKPATRGLTGTSWGKTPSSVPPHIQPGRHPNISG
ncbi:hypothetical protein BC628DRAFT_1320341 [Trametes gibbosa]|nr:hypothetical protein BC628DRAFT_1320341 [Trametes gibbosa]